METFEKEILPLQETNQREMQMDPLERLDPPSIPSLMMVGDQNSVFDQGVDFSSSHEQWSFEELYAAVERDMEREQEDIVDPGGIEGGVDGGPDLFQQGSFNMDEIFAEMVQPSEAQVQAHVMPTTEQQIGPSAALTADQRVELENFLGKAPNLVQGVFTGKEFSAFEISPRPVYPMQHVNRHGPLVDPVGLPNCSYLTIGDGMKFSNGCLEKPLVPFPNQAQAEMNVTIIPNSSNGMTSIAHASLLRNGDSVVMNKRSKRRRRAHDVEFIENNMDEQMKTRIRKRESDARVRAKKQIRIMQLESQLENLKEENKRLKAKQVAVEKVMKMLKVEMALKKSGRAMHRRSNSCPW